MLHNFFSNFFDKWHNTMGKFELFCEWAERIFDIS